MFKILNDHQYPKVFKYIFLVQLLFIIIWIFIIYIMHYTLKKNYSIWVSNE